MAERFVDFSSSSIDDFIVAQKNQNTVKKTNQDVGLFQKFLETKSESRELELIDAPSLNEYISEFVVVVRQKKTGKNYEPDSLQSMFNSISRYLLDKKYPLSIMTAPEFNKSRNALKSKKKELKKEGYGNKPNEAESLTKAEIKILYEKKQLGPFSALSLTNTVWLNNMLFFGMRSCTVHRNLKWGDISIQKTNDGVEYLLYDKERQTKTRQGDTNDRRKVKGKGFMTLNRPNVGSSLIDPVEMFKLYSSKRPLGMSDDESPFYLGINIVRKIDSSKPWFVKAAIGVNKLNGLMKTMATAAGLEGRFTNHSGRKTMMQTFVNNNVPPTQIIQHSGHKNLQSVNSYSHITTEQQQNMSDMLSDLGNFEEPSAPQAVAVNNPPSVSNSGNFVTALQQRSQVIAEEIASQDPVRNFSLSASIPDSPKTVYIGQKRSVSQQRNENLDSCFSLFTGAQIHGGVTINVNNPGPAYKKRKPNRLIIHDSSDESQ